MDLRTSESRFRAFVEGLVSVIGHADRARPLFDYCIGLIMPGERKSVELMAAVAAPNRTAAQHQSLLHFAGQSPWSDEGVLAKVGEMVLPAIERHGAIEAWIIVTPVFPRRERTRSVWRVNIAGSSASRVTAKSRCRCRLSQAGVTHMPCIERDVPDQIGAKIGGTMAPARAVKITGSLQGNLIRSSLLARVACGSS